MNAQPMVITYISALSNYLNTVNQRHPNANNPNKTSRIIQTLAGCGAKGRGGGRGSRRGRRGGRGSGSGNPNARRNDEWKVTGIDGRMIKVHIFYRFKQDK